MLLKVPAPEAGVFLHSSQGSPLTSSGSTFNTQPVDLAVATQQTHASVPKSPMSLGKLLDSAAKYRLDMWALVACQGGGPELKEVIHFT